MGIWFYNRYGTPQIILGEQGRFMNRHGHNLGYVKDNKYIYNYRGKHCGWIENYVIRDLYGHVVAFCDHSNDFPVPIFPIHQIPPIPAIPQIPPTIPAIPAIPQIPKLKPIKSFGWSQYNLTNLFD